MDPELEGGAECATIIIFSYNSNNNYCSRGGCPLNPYISVTIVMHTEMKAGLGASSPGKKLILMLSERESGAICKVISSYNITSYMYYTTRGATRAFMRNYNTYYHQEIPV